MEEVFKEYVSTFDMSIPEINRKYDHSLRVMDICEKIATYLNLSEEEITLAKQIGLLHDFGRFEQWKIQQSYNDTKKCDHGELGVELLFDKGLINKFNITDHHEIIYKAIKYHNRFELPKLDSYTELFCNIVRDADKIDILYLVSMGEYGIINNTPEAVTEINIKDFYEGKSLKNENKKNSNDNILLILAFVNNFAFDISKKYVIKNNLIINMYNGLKYKEPLKEYFMNIIQKKEV